MKEANLSFFHQNICAFRKEGFARLKGMESNMPAKKKATFEDDLTKLAQIVEQVEDSQTPLDKALTLYKEGLTLAAKCGETLTGYENEIQVLQKNADETFELSSFAEI